VEASEQGDAKLERNLAARAERSLREADRTLKKIDDPSPQDTAMAQLDQARVYALLQLAEDIRNSRRG